MFSNYGLSVNLAFGELLVTIIHDKINLKKYILSSVICMMEVGRYGYLFHENDQCITSRGGAREHVTKMNLKNIKTFTKHYKEHK